MKYEEKFFSLENIVITIKAMAISLLTALIFLPVMFLIRLFLGLGGLGNIALSGILGIVSIFFYLLLYGFLAQKIWGWY